MRRTILFCTTLILSGCIRFDASPSGQPPFNDFAYDDSDAIPNEIPLPKPGINQRPVVGTKKVLVSIIHWQDGDTLDPLLINTHTISNHPDSLRSYVLAASQGKLVLDGQVISYTSGPRPELCSKNIEGSRIALAAQEGRKAAESHGLNTADFDFFINVIDCRGGASAWMPGASMGIYGQSRSPHVYKHEFGHNLGYSHGKTYTRCPGAGDRIDAPTHCTTINLGDTGDSVSGGGTLYPANNRWYSGWLNASQAVVISRSGYYRLGVLGAPGSEAPQLYLINRSDTPSQLALEYRKPTPFDDFPPSDNRVNGVWMRYTSMTGAVRNTQLDATPETASTADPALAANGRYIFDSAAGITVRVCLTTPTYAEVAVGVNSGLAPSCIRPTMQTDQQ